MQIRINKYLSTCGIASRRKADELINQGLITVNGKKALIGQGVDPENDAILFNGKPTQFKHDLIYIALNKPFRVVSTVSDDRNRPTVINYVPFKERLYPVGRLDYESTGLVLLTNDGDLALKITHPRYHLPKTYVVTTIEEFTTEQLSKLSNGISLDGKVILPAIVTKLNPKTFQIIIRQGLNRQIRRMCEKVNLTIKTLHRTQIGPIRIGDLKKGEYRLLKKTELKQLQELLHD